MELRITLLFSLIMAADLTAQPAGENLAITEARFIPMEKTIYYKLGDRTIPLKLIQYGPVSDIFCFNMHDNETTSVNAARSVLELRGGTLLKIENNEQRLVKFRLRGVFYAFDPNRIFSKTGIEQTLEENGKVSPEAVVEVEKFALRLLQLVPAGIACIIALHNNTEGAWSVKSYLSGGDRQKDAREVYTGSSQDEDDIVFTTDRLIFEKMAASGYNSILQDNEKARKDGSLSVYFGEQNRPNVNIETEHGHTGQYRQMLEKLLAFLMEKKQAGHGTAEVTQ
ncbi:MAG: hypothetical protein FJY20_09815 [Bacteroidetes bacterium]|nr:hypothetical protein [Bacteroidota bacterium]